MPFRRFPSSALAEEMDIPLKNNSPAQTALSAKISKTKPFQKNLYIRVPDRRGDQM
jgi:hypothetical protein